MASFERVLRNGPQNTWRLYCSWTSDQRLRYITHMKRLAAQDPDKYHLFADIVTQVSANLLGD